MNINITVPETTFDFNGTKITPLPVFHGNLKVYGYRINDLTYITDANHIPDDTRKFIVGSKVLVINGLRWEPEHPTHFTIPEAVKIARELNVEKTFLIHMSSYVNHEETNKRLPDGIQLAYDQLTIEMDQ